MAEQKFGGPWTEKKLKALEAYLKAYLRIFTSNPSAQHFTRHYVDAFAGSGLRHTHSQPALPLKLPKDGDVLNEAQAFMEGSVRKVLSLDDPFHNYWFIENNVNYAKHLKDSIKSEFPDRFPLCHIETQDSNEFLINWSESLGRNDRAVVFLDPYGMQVHWSTVEILAYTQKIDLWMLFPSSSVIRMLPKAGPPEEAWSKRLTELFGDESWKSEFYQHTEVDDLFGGHEEIRRTVNEQTVANYLLRRLGGIFAEVIDQPLVLYNSKQSPLFMLVFAAGNPKGAPTARKIAESIVKKTR